MEDLYRQKRVGQRSCQQGFRQGTFRWSTAGVYQADDLTRADQVIQDWLM